MFGFAFDQALFEFAEASPQFEPLFELPPKNHSCFTDTPTTEGRGFFVIQSFFLSGLWGLSPKAE